MQKWTQDEAIDYECTTFDFQQRKYTVTYSESRPYYDDSCQIREIDVIDNTLPAYCVAYQGHDYTYQIGVNYVGDSLNGGHWIEQD
jgi:hypothetical protein